MKKQNSNLNVMVEKMVVLLKTFDHFHRKFQLFQLPWNLKLKFRSKFNHEFTNHDYLHSAV